MCMYLFYGDVTAVVCSNSGSDQSIINVSEKYHNFSNLASFLFVVDGHFIASQPFYVCKASFILHVIWLTVSLLSKVSNFLGFF